MQIDVSPRRSGKTTRMLEWLAGNEDGILVVHSAREVDRLRKLVKDQDLNIDPDKIISASNLTNLRGLKGKIGIDELQFVLNNLLALPVERISISEDQEHYDW